MKLFKQSKFLSLLGLALAFGLMVIPFFSVQATDYDPTGVAVCELGSTAAKICWKTVGKSNSAIEYGITKVEENTQIYTDYTKTNDHFAPLSKLKPSTKYIYRVWSSPGEADPAYKSEIMCFQTPKADGTGGDTACDPGSGGTNTNGGGGSNTNDSGGSVVIPPFSNPFGSSVNSVPGIANRIINVLFALIIIAAVIVIIVAGFRMILGGSNPEQIKKARTAIVWAIIGLAVAFMSFAIVSIVQKLL